MDFLKAFLLAFVEGVTEFLPISSTGHLILLDQVLRLGGDEAFTNAFVVIIQLPAIFAVVLYFWKDLWPLHAANNTREVLRLWLLTAVAFLPAAVFGLLLDDLIDAWLFNSLTVALALVIGGVILIVVERRKHAERYATVHDFHWALALGIGFIQCLAMIPGTSRSAATIIGALLLGASRAAAAEFSFFLAVPTMLGATTLKLLKNGLDFSQHQWILLVLGAVVSFVTAYAVIAFLMHFIRRHSFAVFGYYRIVLGILVLVLLFA